MTVGEADDAEGSPWAGDVPAPAAPIEFAWARVGEHEVVSPLAQAADAQPARQAPIARTQRRRLVFGSIAAVILLVFGGLLVGWGRGDDLDTTETPTPTDAPDAVGDDDSLPSPGGPVDTELDAAEGTGSTSRTRPDELPEWREDIVVLPEVLLDTSVAFDVVALTSTGDYVEVAIPSGKVDLLEVGQGIDGRVVAGESATLFVTYRSTQGGRLLREGEPPLEVALPPNIDISQVGAVGDEFAGVAYGNGQPSLVRVLADGGVVTTSIDNSPESFGSGSTQVSPDGRWLRDLAPRGDFFDEVLIDLTTGDRTEFEVTNAGTGGKVWAPDSSGIFRQSLSRGFEFYVVATGETIMFGAELERLVSIDIRIAVEDTTVPSRTPTATGVELIALTAAGDVAQIDVDTGAVVITNGPGLDSSAPVMILPDAAGATFTSYDSVPSMRFVADELSAFEIPGSSPNGPVWPGPTPGSLWQTTDPIDADALALGLVDVHGNELGESIEFDAVGLNSIVGSDGRGGMVIESQLGGVFIVDATNPPERITSGELLAIGVDAAFVRECDGAFQCGVFAVDRESGSRTRVDDTGFSTTRDLGSRSVPSGQNVSPDGTIAFVHGGGDRTRCLMIDTAAGSDTWTGVPCVDFASPIIWTSDSAYAVWLEDGRVTIYERSTRSVRLVDTVTLSAIAAVPVAAAAPSDTSIPADETVAE